MSLEPNKDRSRTASPLSNAQQPMYHVLWKGLTPQKAIGNDPSGRQQTHRPVLDGSRKRAICTIGLRADAGGYP